MFIISYPFSGKKCHQILFPINSLVASAALWTTYLEAVFSESSPVLVAVSNNFFHVFKIDFSKKKDKKFVLFIVSLASNFSAGLDLVSVIAMNASLTKTI